MRMSGRIPLLLGVCGNSIGGVQYNRLAERMCVRRAYSLIALFHLTITAALLVTMSQVDNRIAIVFLAGAAFGVMDLMLPAAWAMCMAIGGKFGGPASGIMNTAGNFGGFIDRKRTRLNSRH